MYRTTPITVALLLTVTTAFAQNNESRETENVGDLSELISKYTETIPPQYPLRNIKARDTELSLFDQVVTAVHLIFRPSQAFDYWPEYLYEYSDISDTELCKIEYGPKTNNFDLGTVALVELKDSVYEGVALLSRQDAEGNDGSLHVADFCNELGRIESALKNDKSIDPNKANTYFAMSKAFPDRKVEFSGRVRMQTLSSTIADAAISGE